tara:strand:- start:1659 stop:2027 length:369 start_codon:yes stop_codon:yes gene_type:complete
MIDKKFMDDSENLSDDCFEEKLTNKIMQQEQSEQEYIIDQVAEVNPEAIILEPRSTFNRAIIGSDVDNRIVYSSNKILRAFMDEDGMTEQEALEYFEFNTLGTIQPMDNPNKPLFVYDEFIF